VSQGSFAQPENNPIASGKETSLDLPMSQCAHTFLGTVQAPWTTILLLCLAPSDLFTQVILSVARPGFLPNIYSWSQCGNFILQTKNPCFPVQESKPLVRAISWR